MSTDAKSESISFEVKCGIVIAIFAAFMSISDLFAGKYGDDEIMLTNEKASQYQWFQSKSIKENLAEAQRDLLISLAENDVIDSKHKASINGQIEKLNKKINKYGKEKNEILLGSNAVGKENWVQEVDGEMGKITGAKELEAQLGKLSKAGDYFDYGTLFYQMCLVLGAICLIIKNEKMQNIFFYIMISLGSIASVFSVFAFRVIL